MNRLHTVKPWDLITSSMGPRCKMKSRGGGKYRSLRETRDDNGLEVRLGASSHYSLRATSKVGFKPLNTVTVSVQLYSVWSVLSRIL